MLSVALSLPLAEDCASKKKKKVAGDICFPEKKSPHPPHRCERRRQRQTSAQSCGSHWLAVCTKSNSKHFTHNTPTNPKGVHAASSITPPLPHRFKASCRRSAFNFQPHRRPAPERGWSAPALRRSRVFLSARTSLTRAHFYYFSWRKASRQRTLRPSIPG